MVPHRASRRDWRERNEGEEKQTKTKRLQDGQQRAARVAVSITVSRAHTLVVVVSLATRSLDRGKRVSWRGEKGKRVSERPVRLLGTKATWKFGDRQEVPSDSEAAQNAAHCYRGGASTLSLQTPPLIIDAGPGRCEGTCSARRPPCSCETSPAET